MRCSGVGEVGGVPHPCTGVGGWGGKSEVELGPMSMIVGVGVTEGPAYHLNVIGDRWER